ncbi:uncharacterized protein LOC112511975 isoform X2 [Cynara cardunculus var. scolymus]|uniref:Uncharacterized protein n=1 Tax=Cynara cardunculus var. scolymus TaxID=59895 RepID=A0A103Y5T0_CYNCS|nr:uncharacterized protein LOC112511975 isoform X2 [Cynara cardunculus var. scolymus]KVI03027.1 hypothetical protein Ccrd_018684 [Cynara cardunculus var. scolymus]
MKELAKQELKILEAQHPTRFQHLKLQLKEFIHLLDEDEEQHSFERKQQQQRLHMSILTQESSSRKREKEGEKDEGCTKRRRRQRQGGGINSAIQKAEACLCKILDSNMLKQQGK